MLYLIAYFKVQDMWQPDQPFFLKHHKFENNIRDYLYNWPDVELPPYDVRKYIIRMGIWGGSLHFAHVTVKVAARNALDTIFFNFGWPSTDSVKYNGSSVSFSMTGSDSARKLIVPLPSTLYSGDTAYVDVFYSGSPSSTCMSFGGGLSIQSPTWAFTDNEPYGFRCWVPSYDQPYEKADEGVEFYITTDTSLEVVANGVLNDTMTSGSLRTWHYIHRHPIAPYLITFAIRDLLVNQWVWNYGSISMPVRSWVPVSDPSYNWGDSLTVMLTAFSSRYGLYPFADEKYEQSYVLPGGWAMEDQTNSFFGGYYSTPIQAHELSHHWWGNSVTCGTFKDIWLNEGFATYSEAIWREHTGGWNGYIAYYNRRVDTAIFTYASNPGLPVYDPGPDMGSIFSVYTYNKGAAVLHMLRYVLDKDTSLFFGALRFYRSRHEGSYALTSDFVDDVQTYTGRDLRWFFDQWVYQPGWPVYNVRWNRFNRGSTWDLLVLVEQTQPAGAPTFKMPIEVRVFTPSGDTTFTIWDSLDVQHFWITLNDRPDSLAWDPDNWVLEQHSVTYDPSLNVSEEPTESRREIVIKVEGREVTVLAPLGKEEVSVYDRSGRLVAKGRRKLKLALRAGIYYAKSGAEVKAFTLK